ncbi:hypothetical protein NPIL_623981 [Nephila pilipes]|uniref:Uncharacterized protein n=1 Tax=Nephila pilipes TaxID=299642 RepID=A0A8X6R461_NEPPI|nr:hypothetical protein NPIL_623981 [Nephila pilipes]
MAAVVFASLMHDMLSKIVRDIRDQRFSSPFDGGPNKDLAFNSTCAVAMLDAINESINPPQHLISWWLLI